MLTATCLNCGSPKEPANYADTHCPGCTTRQREAEQHFAAENPGATEGAIIYAGRQALMQVAHHAHRNFVDPRGFSAAHGMIPVPPRGGDRGGPA